MTPERIGMASELGSTNSNDSYLDFLTTDWCTDWDILQGSGPDLFASEDVSLQKILELPLPPLSSTDEFHPTFPSETLQDTSLLQAVRQIALPSLPDVPGPSSFQPRTTAIPLDDATNGGACYEGVAGRGLWATGGIDSSVAVPAIPSPAPSSLPATIFPLNWIKVPQRHYDQGRKQWNFKRLEPVSFSVGGRPGINMRDALRKKFDGLDGRDDRVLQEVAGAISCRLLFPGYPPNGSSCQIHVLDWTRSRLPITRSKLAHEVARKLERYLQYMAKVTLDNSVENRWAIGQGFMHIDNMFLVRLASVSKGSFQPEIWVVDPSMSHPHVPLV